MKLTLYAYDGEQGADAHAIQLELSREDVQRYYRQKGRERVGRYDFGKYIEVTDQGTGERWKIASAPCGEACHCAAVAVRVPFCENCGATEDLVAGVHVDGLASERLGISPDQDGGYRLCQTCAAMAVPA